MELNRKEIIDDILSIEPELKKNRKKLENILEDFILAKPNIEISNEFKKELRHNLLTKMNYNSNIYKNNRFNSLKYFISFILWWVATFSIMWLVWINLDFTDFWNTNNIEILSIQESSYNGDLSRSRAMPENTEVWLMKMDAEPMMEIQEESMIMKTEVFIENNDLFLELETYLKTLSLSKAIIEEILNIIRKYK